MLKVIKAIHVTATEKRHIKQILDAGQVHGRTKIKTYDVIKGTQVGDAWEYDIRITTKGRNDYGEVKYDRQTVTVQYTKHAKEVGA